MLLRRYAPAVRSACLRLRDHPLVNLLLKPADSIRRDSAVPSELTATLEPPNRRPRKPGPAANSVRTSPFHTSAAALSNANGVITPTSLTWSQLLPEPYCVFSVWPRTQ